MRTNNLGCSKILYDGLENFAESLLEGRAPCCTHTSDPIPGLAKLKRPREKWGTFVKTSTLRDRGACKPKKLAVEP